MRTLFLAWMWMALSLANGGDSGNQTVSPEEAWQRGWPQLHGPTGNFAVLNCGIKVVSDPKQIKKLWESEYYGIGIGKFGVRPAGAYKNVTHDRKYQGGYASPVLANGTLYIVHYQPHGDVFDKDAGDRNLSMGQAATTILADDVIAALDATTGKTKWVSTQTGKGMNYLMDKRGGWGISAAVHEDKVFAVGTTGRLYALNAATGELVWESTVGATHEALEVLKAKNLEEQRSAGRTWTWASCPVIADGVLVVPDYAGRTNGLRGINPADGKLLWEAKGVCAATATPALAELEGRAYLLCATHDGKLSLLDPKTGQALWTKTGLGVNPRTLQPVDGHVIVNVLPTADKEHGLFGCLKFDTRGAEEIWRLPDQLEYKHEWWPDGGAHRKFVIGDGVVHFSFSPRESKGSKRHTAWMRVKLADGAIISYRATEVGMTMPYLVEDTIVYFGDLNHHPAWGKWYLAKAHLADNEALPEPHGFEHNLTSGYELQLEFPIVAGRIFMRTLEGRIACYDLRAE